MCSSLTSQFAAHNSRPAPTRSFGSNTGTRPGHVHDFKFPLTSGSGHEILSSTKPYPVPSSRFSFIAGLKAGPINWAGAELNKLFGVRSGPWAGSEPSMVSGVKLSLWDGSELNMVSGVGPGLWAGFEPISLSGQSNAPTLLRQIPKSISWSSSD